MQTISLFLIIWIIGFCFYQVGKYYYRASQIYKSEKAYCKIIDLVPQLDLEDLKDCSDYLKNEFDNRVQKLPLIKLKVNCGAEAPLD